MIFFSFWLFEWLTSIALANAFQFNFASSQCGLTLSQLLRGDRREAWLIQAAKFNKKNPCIYSV
ncbi:hypothetical protein CSQ79_20100 [Gloeocapsopsis sp. IPPAS B-1203]|nr:hypothetical protein CSQ79_20100 [Gloeocapsopsis sp. IPPAS B-1203]